MSVEDSSPIHVRWEDIDPSWHAGESGAAAWRTVFYGNRRIRQVEYSPGYSADHWCNLGHIVLCISGSLHTEFSEGPDLDITAGEMYAIEDNLSSHRSSTEHGAILLIIDTPPQTKTHEGS